MEILINIHRLSMYVYVKIILKKSLKILAEPLIKRGIYMWSDDEMEADLHRTKFFSGIGCFIWAIVLFLIIAIPTVKFFANLYDEIILKEKELVVSQSPNKINKLEVLQKGSSVSFGDATILIRYKNKEMKTHISNDGKDIHPSTDISIIWKNDEEATITLDGEQQFPEIIEFKVPHGKVSNSSPFIVVQQKIGYATFQKSESPNRENVVELKTIAYSKGVLPKVDYSSIRVYYGKIGANLQKYVEFQVDKKYSVNYFEIVWKDEQHLIIQAFERENGKSSIVNTKEIEIK